LNLATYNLLVGWVAMLAGVLSGAAIGLFFHQEEWLGGYGAYRRRMTRLGHISLFGLGFLVAELESGLRWLAARLYSEEFTRERRKRFHRRWRTLRHDKDRRQEEIGT
jgi:hypothetical protein